MDREGRDSAGVSDEGELGEDSVDEESKLLEQEAEEMADVVVIGSSMQQVQAIVSEGSSARVGPAAQV